MTADTGSAATPAFDGLLLEAMTISATIAETINDGILPDGLWANEARLARVVNHLRAAIETMGLEADPEPVGVDRIHGQDLGWLVSVGEVPPHDVARTKAAVTAALGEAIDDLALQGVEAYQSAMPR